MSAYFITFHTYGSWLHGRAPGSIDRQHNTVGTAFAPTNAKRLTAMQDRMTADAFLLKADQRRVVRAAIEGVALHRGWTLSAIHVRTNHVHVVVAADVPPERIMNDFKSWATRRLREAGLVTSDAKVWGRHGSTRYLHDTRAVENACRYVLDGQGVELD